MMYEDGLIYFAVADTYVGFVQQILNYAIKDKLANGNNGNNENAIEIDVTKVLFRCIERYPGALPTFKLFLNAKYFDYVSKRVDFSVKNKDNETLQQLFQENNLEQYSSVFKQFENKLKFKD